MPNPNNTLHRTMPRQLLPRAGLRLAYMRHGQRWLSPADWLAAVYAAAGLAVLAIVWALLAMPADCAQACLAAHL